jgi:hypothetical protein
LGRLLENETEPPGAEGASPPVSVTLTAQVVRPKASTLDGVHETAVDVGRPTGDAAALCVVAATATRANDTATPTTRPRMSRFIKPPPPQRADTKSGSVDDVFNLFTRADPGPVGFAVRR